MALRLHNTLGRELQEFVPLNDGQVGLYCCGPTVYNYAHIGNLRTYVFEDVLRRTLEYLGHTVRHVMNVTDVGHLTDDGDEGEDKMIVGAREQGMTVSQIAEHFTDAFFRDLDELNIARPSVVCRATDHIDEMQQLIAKLEARDLTYESGGNVYFSIDDSVGYGRLALLDRQELKAGARIVVDQQKRNPHDFGLWFTKSKFGHQAMLWDSPWGRGYPGWHIECSAMSMKYLGESFDIHCGGVDAISVHHTNEIAQTEGATGHRWVTYWVHGEHLIMDTGRMGKSEGNAITLETVKERGFEPLDYRYFLFGAHYRTQLTFSWHALSGARNARVALVDRVAGLAQETGKSDGAPVDELGESARVMRDAMIESISDDMNIPKALGQLWALMKDVSVPAGDRLGVALDMDRVLGLKLADAAAGGGAALPEDLAALISERERA
ncbi:MAG: cysteine--tRNA ligase, partial [Spirochaetia bacterium]